MHVFNMIHVNLELNLDSFQIKIGGWHLNGMTKSGTQD